MCRMLLPQKSYNGNHFGPAAAPAVSRTWDFSDRPRPLWVTRTVGWGRNPFRTIQVSPKDLPGHAAAVWRCGTGQFSWEGLTMSERAIEERQGWASDIIGVGIGLYSVLFLLVTFLCIYVPA